MNNTYIRSTLHLVVEERIFSDTFLGMTRCASEVDIVGLCPFVLHRKLPITLAALGWGFYQSMILSKLQRLFFSSNLVMQWNEIKSHFLKLFAKYNFKYLISTLQIYRMYTSWYIYITLYVLFCHNIRECTMKYRSWRWYIQSRMHTSVFSGTEFTEKEQGNMNTHCLLSNTCAVIGKLLEVR